MKPIIETFTGKQICPLDLKVADVDIKDIAKSLSNTCRFGGHIDDFYSTAEHSVHCWRMAKELESSPLIHMAVLLHDACEGLTAIDHVKPCKSNYAVALPPNGEIVTINELERRISDVIATALGLTLNFHDPFIKSIDGTMLNTEMLRFRNKRSSNPYGVFNLELPCWVPKVAYKEFLKAYEETRCIILGRNST